MYFFTNMNNLNQYISEKLQISSKTNITYKYFPKTKEELRDIINQRIKEEGNNVDLNDIDVSNITNMSILFYDLDFNGDISKWNVSNVTDMRYMFQISKFNGDISKWNVSNVEDMHGMFSYSIFDGDISNWNISNVQDIGYMFAYSKFTGKNGDISRWNTSNVIDMSDMFYGCPLQKNPPKWYEK